MLPADESEYFSMDMAPDNDGDDDDDDNVVDISQRVTEYDLKLREKAGHREIDPDEVPRWVAGWLGGWVAGQHPFFAEFCSISTGVCVCTLCRIALLPLVGGGFAAI